MITATDTGASALSDLELLDAVRRHAAFSKCSRVMQKKHLSPADANLAPRQFLRRQQSPAQGLA